MACNIYHRPQADDGAFDQATGQAPQPASFYFGCTNSSQAGTKVDCNWMARDRKTTVTPRGQTPPAGQSPSPDYVGIYIRAEHSYITGVLGDSMTITDASVNLIEPQGYSITT